MKARRDAIRLLLFVSTLGPPAQTLPQKPAAPVVTPPREPGLYVRIQTSLGNITARLYDKEAPVTVWSFVNRAQGKRPFKDPGTGEWVSRRFYDGLTFHRVIPGFIIQTGDPTGTGEYDPGFTVPDEFDPSLKFDRPGRMGMANSGSKNSGSCQFFITEVPAPHLNNLHTIFGQVVEGQDVVRKIAAVPRAANGTPRTPVTIIRLLFLKEAPAAVADQ